MEITEASRVKDADDVAGGNDEGETRQSHCDGYRDLRAPLISQLVCTKCGLRVCVCDKE